MLYTTLVEHRDGKIVVDVDGIIYFLTPCCNASATGTQDGTACRGCYRLIDSFYGMAATWKSETLRTDLRDMISLLFQYDTTRSVDTSTLHAESKIRSMQRHPSRAGRI